MLRRLAPLLLLLAAAPVLADVADPGDSDSKSDKKDDSDCSQVPGGAVALPSLLAGMALLWRARRP